MTGTTTAHAQDQALVPLGPSILDEALLARIAGRATGYDRGNRFFHEDLVELRDAGYLRLTVPKELGGFGLTLPQYVREVARLAYRAPSTALALNMHAYWTGAATYLWQRGGTSAQWILEEAVQGRLFAAGHGEPGNDVALAHSFVDAKPLPDGDYSFTRRKVFTSLSPAWNWLGVHGFASSDPEHPKIVHAFIRRDTPGIRTLETWNALGLRATASDDTILEGAIAAPEHVTRVLPAGPPNDPFIDGIFGWAIPGISIVYYGIAKRTFDVAPPAPASAPRWRSAAAATRIIRWRRPISPRLRSSWTPSRRWSSALPPTGRRACRTASSGQPKSWPPSNSPPTPREKWSILPPRSPALPRSPARASWSGCIATCAPAASIRRAATRRTR